MSFNDLKTNLFLKKSAREQKKKEKEMSKFLKRVDRDIKKEKKNLPESINHQELFSSDTDEDRSVLDKNREEKSINGEEILFRGIPWGSNIKSVFTSLPELVSKSHLQSNFGDAKTTVSFWPYSEDSSMNFKNQHLTKLISIEKLKGLEVAGEQLDKVLLYFTFVPENGKLVRKDENTALYAAEYVFHFYKEFNDYRYDFDSNNDTDKRVYEGKKDENTRNLEKRIDSFLPKLINRYGPYDKSAKYGKVYCWYGKNDTELQLYIKDKSRHNEQFRDDIINVVWADITISYLWHKGDEMLAKADNATVYEEINTDGL